MSGLCVGWKGNAENDHLHIPARRTGFPHILSAPPQRRRGLPCSSSGSSRFLRFRVYTVWMCVSYGATNALLLCSGFHVKDYPPPLRGSVCVPTTFCGKNALRAGPPGEGRRGLCNEGHVFRGGLP